MAVRRTRPPQPLAPARHSRASGRVRRGSARRGHRGRSVGDRRRGPGDDGARARRPRGAARGTGLRGAAPRRPPRHLRRDVRPVVPRRARRADGGRGRRRRCRRNPERPAAEDVEAMRDALLAMLADNADLGNIDDRLAAMIAQIVESFGRYNSSRGPSYSSYQALKAMALDELEGRLLAGLLAPTATIRRPRRSRSPKRLLPAHLATAPDGGGGDQAPHRRATRPRPRADVRHSAAGRERRVPARLRRAAAPDASRRRTAGAHAWPPGWRPGDVGPGAARSTCARRCASRCRPAACRSTSC